MGLKTEGEKLCFQGGLFSRAIHVALHTANPDASNELTGGGYARATTAEADWTVDAATGEASNATGIAFPDPEATWGDPTHVALWSEATGGDLLASAELANDVPAPAPGAEVSFPVGTLAFAIATD